MRIVLGVSNQSRLERKRNKHTHTHQQKIKNTRIYVVRSRWPKSTGCNWGFTFIRCSQLFSE
ncbi:hypothetical protein Hanom_Chr09g00767101 [Helianthus anomalus]